MEEKIKKIRILSRRNIKIFIFIGFLFVFFGFCAKADAATLYFSPSSGSYSVGDDFSISVLVSSENQSINAISGTVLFPTDKLEIVSFSKSDSLFASWIKDPIFSNIEGFLSFEGIILNPGFIGSAGKVMTINFRPKTVGDISLAFSSGFILANDGYGTDVTESFEKANFKLVEKVPTPVIKKPDKPIIFSSTHPDPEKWYLDGSPEFYWKLPDDVSDVYLSFSAGPTSTPISVFEGLAFSKKYENIQDGIWHFYAKFKNKDGWGEISDFKIQIDSTSPRPFEIEVKEGKETSNPQPTLLFEAFDSVSGIDHYEIKIDQKSLIKTEGKEYKIPLQSPGEHVVLVRAVDRAGNYTLAMTEIIILPIETPIIVDYPKKLFVEEILLLKGKSVPNATIKINIYKNGRQLKTEDVKSDDNGDWVYFETEPVGEGIYEIQFEAEDIFGGKSELSEKISILVSARIFIGAEDITVKCVIGTIIFLLLIILILFLLWRKIWQKKRNIKKEVAETEQVLRQSFEALSRKTEEQIAGLDGEPGLSDNERRISESLKEALRSSEEFIGKEIRDIKEEIK